MGTKKELASTVCDAISKAAPGPVLDAFAGMCSVGEALGERRPVWTNDVQLFAFVVGQALFTSSELPYDAKRTADVFFEDFYLIQKSLEGCFEQSITAEEAALNSNTFAGFAKQKEILDRLLSSEISRFKRSRFSLFTEFYAGSFHSLSQCIELDAIIGSISLAREAKRISAEQYNWLIIGLGRVMLRCSASTGHFAQYLKPNEKNYKFLMRQHRRLLWHEWLCSMEELSPVGSQFWRSSNKVFNCDANILIDSFKLLKYKPAVVYADPPYTADHYSRYYHLFETMVAYDFPALTGRGKYRPERFHSPYSIKTKSAAAIRDLVEKTAAIGADLVLSYPTNGLAYKAGASPLSILKKSFRRVEITHKVRREHSTLGASKGEARAEVVEQIYLGRH